MIARPISAPMLQFGLMVMGFVIIIVLAFTEELKQKDIENKKNNRSKK